MTRSTKRLDELSEEIDENEIIVESEKGDPDAIKISISCHWCRETGVRGPRQNCPYCYGKGYKLEYVRVVDEDNVFGLMEGT